MQSSVAGSKDEHLHSFFLTCERQEYLFQVWGVSLSLLSLTSIVAIAAACYYYSIIYNRILD